MSGAGIADWVFRILMGAILLGWVAWMFTIQAEFEYEQARTEAETRTPAPVTTFADEPYDSADPALVDPDPYAVAQDEVMREDLVGDDGDWVE